MKRLIRYLKMLYIVCCKGGYARAKLLKKWEYFKKQGENCFFQPWNFGSEPYLISFGNNVHIASGSPENLEISSGENLESCSMRCAVSKACS